MVICPPVSLGNDTTTCPQLHVRKVFKRIGTQIIHTVAMPTNVLEKSVADVSFLSGMLVDKFLYHLPLYRQHQRLQQAGITLSRSTLTNLTSHKSFGTDSRCPVIKRIAKSDIGDG